MPYEEALSLLRQSGVTTWEALALAELGDTRLMTGDVAGAVPLLDEALSLNRRIEFPLGIAVTLGERAHAARLQGDQVLAARLFAREHRRGGGDRLRAPLPGGSGGAGRRCPGTWAAGASGTMAGRGGDRR